MIIGHFLHNYMINNNIDPKKDMVVLPLPICTTPSVDLTDIELDKLNNKEKLELIQNNVEKNIKLNKELNKKIVIELVQNIGIGGLSKNEFSDILKMVKTEEITIEQIKEADGTNKVKKVLICVLTIIALAANIFALDFFALPAIILATVMPLSTAHSLLSLSYVVLSTTPVACFWMDLERSRHKWKEFEEFRSKV